LRFEFTRVFVAAFACSVDASSRPWMIIEMLRPDEISVDVRIKLRRCDIRMTKHFLHCPQICSAFQQMRGKRMAERMRMNFLVDSRAACVFLHDVPDGCACHSPSPPIQKQYIVRGFPERML
jgi:hypothetical protein